MDSKGRVLGNHAVSIQRVAVDRRTNEVRVYFYNPNEVDEQQWGPLHLSVWAHGERPGESSLSMAEFVAVLNAFPYDTTACGAGKIPASDHEQLQQLLGPLA